ncbi:urease accessory protein UreF [Marinomonas posidonica]|uniref:Urease accessory protein UreF n=1 Tax=Marinomonas posidonica (strain CECT 7376 / NCIMB 14433 / IVIA-Po-181) TaxID=491952 RepID=F6CSK9_MARPP|nr:urease accessory protein UreF [Marinomonas posidonica]AEF56167.1 Urease accessory protein ureF [Marinomonas posidonica IVIA-Po-181]
MVITTTDHALLRLLQLSSVSLPVGGYAFSQGMEYAIDCGWVSKQEDVADWTHLQLMQSFSRVDLPILRLAMQAWEEQNQERLVAINDLVLACRETKELRLNDTAMGEALARLLRSLDVPVPFERLEEISFVVLFAVAARYWKIEFETAALGFAWSWLENQIAAATKLVPLGQTQSQRLIGQLQPALSEAINIAAEMQEEDIGAGLPALAIASSLHETQYSRLFRS